MLAQLRRPSGQRLLARLFALLLVVAATAVLSAPAADYGGVSNERDSRPDRAGDSQQKEIIREGTRVELTGYFKSTGDRLTFYYLEGEGEVRIRALENLSLQRIARVMTETPNQLEWNITATVTEYRGNNFLLVTKAVLRSRAIRRNRQ